jgi:hypothetical protein
MGPVRSDVDIARLVRPDAVHREIYEDPAVFSEEMDRIFPGDPGFCRS